jgi:osmotically-inducible protein OsmY
VTVRGTEQMRNEADLRGDVLHALMLDSLVPKTVEALVGDGYVTLTGSVNWRYQREEAESVRSVRRRGGSELRRISP